jgi:DNA-binding FadR family transcriptional regulator
LAAQRITEEEVAALEEFVAKFEADSDLHSIDIEFHEMIIEAVQNPILSRFMASLHRLGRASRIRTVQLPGVRELVIEDHQAIVAALKARDPQAARQAMLQHLHNVEKRLKEVYSQ